MTASASLSNSSTRLTTPKPVEVVERRANVTKWFALLGLGFVVLMAYVYISWIAAGDAHSIGTGSDPVPTSVKILAWVVQGASAVVLVAAVIHVVRRSRAEGRLAFDGILLIAWTSALWLDPATNNFLRPNLLYNSYFVNVASWGPHIPGWISPNGGRLPEPILAWVCQYGGVSMFVAMLGSYVMRRVKQRWPRTGRVGLVLAAFAAILTFDLVIEVVSMRAGLWAYPGSIRSLSLFGGTRYEFPLYEVILFGGTWTVMAALRYFQDDQGRTIIERGVDSRSPARRNTLLRILAGVGFVNAVYVVYAMLFSAMTLYGGPFPSGYKSYMINGICGPGTSYVCTSPHEPIPLPGSGPLPPTTAGQRSPVSGAG